MVERLGDQNIIQMTLGSGLSTEFIPQSRQEVFVHEAVHAVASTVLGKDSKERSEN